MKKPPKTYYVIVPYEPSAIEHTVGPDDPWIARIAASFPNHKLTNIVGSNICLIDGEWVENGYYLTFIKEGKGK